MIEAGSFRDPAGFIYFDGSTLLRQINQAGARDYDLLMSSGLYDELVEAGLMVRHEEVAAPDPSAHRTIQPERIPFVSYPYEWTLDQWREAALATLRIQELALRKGMSLKDASAFNIQFLRGKPVLIDTLSLEERTSEEPWIAYGQFCRHFLAPLALMYFRDARMSGLFRSHIDGIPLDLASKLLPGSTKLRFSILSHIHLHAKSGSRYSDKPEAASNAQLSTNRLLALIDNLKAAVGRLARPVEASEWSDYYATADHYSSDALSGKEALISDLLEKAGGDVVWDLGCNTGRFAMIAASQGRSTVAFDSDISSIEKCWKAVSDAGIDNLLPLVSDLTNPTPSLGWAHVERKSLADRGPADVVMALALIHHLAISNNVPLPMVAEYFAQLGRQLIIEWVPKNDVMVRRLLASRKDIFDRYTQTDFEAAFGARFEMLEQHEVSGTERTMYLMRRLDGA